jgi:hypothetical protein
VWVGGGFGDCARSGLIFGDFWGFCVGVGAGCAPVRWVGFGRVGMIRDGGRDNDEGVLCHSK